MGRDLGQVHVHEHRARLGIAPGHLYLRGEAAVVGPGLDRLVPILQPESGHLPSYFWI
jgi:hypothetical protein